MRLPDALLIRDARCGSGSRRRIYDGRTYEAVSIWPDPDAAQVAAAAIRAQGGFARVTQEYAPHHARPLVAIYGPPTMTPWKTNVVSPRRPRWMWVVWSAEKPACAGRTPEEVAP